MMASVSTFSRYRRHEALVDIEFLHGLFFPVRGLLGGALDGVAGFANGGPTPWTVLQPASTKASATARRVAVFS